MSKFTGTTKEFKRYIGPHLRNLVQQITRRHRVAVGACEHCGADGKLEAAHVRGRDRTMIIDFLLGTPDSDASVNVDLKKFEQDFKREHDPVEKSILVLCTNCHRKYDSVPQNMVDTRADGRTNPAELLRHDILPISLQPARPDDFKAMLLKHQEAVIEVFYEDGSVGRKRWNASRFTETSNVFGNLRSRPEFHKGVWQESGIIKVNVRVTE
jgi:hypothetical protein